MLRLIRLSNANYVKWVGTRNCPIELDDDIPTAAKTSTSTTPITTPTILLNNRNDDSFPIYREDTPVLSPEPDSLDVEDGSMTPWGLMQWTTQVHR